MRGSRRESASKGDAVAAHVAAQAQAMSFQASAIFQSFINVLARYSFTHTHTFARSHLVLLTVTVGPYAAVGLRRLQHPVRVIGAILEANRPMLERPLLL